MQCFDNRATKEIEIALSGQSSDAIIKEVMLGESLAQYSKVTFSGSADQIIHLLTFLLTLKKSDELSQILSYLLTVQQLDKFATFAILPPREMMKMEPVTVDTLPTIAIQQDTIIHPERRKLKNTFFQNEKNNARHVYPHIKNNPRIQQPKKYTNCRMFDGPRCVRSRVKDNHTNNHKR